MIRCAFSVQLFAQQNRRKVMKNGFKGTLGVWFKAMKNPEGFETVPITRDDIKLQYCFPGSNTPVLIIEQGPTGTLKCTNGTGERTYNYQTSASVVCYNSPRILLLLDGEQKLLYPNFED
jgi:hypothetical protein